MINEPNLESRREEFERGYYEGFRSIQGNVRPPHAPRIVLETGSKPYEQGWRYGIRDAGAKK